MPSQIKTTYFKTSYSEEYSSTELLSERIESIIEDVNHNQPSDENLVGRIGYLENQVSRLCGMMGFLFQKLADADALTFGDLHGILDPEDYYSRANGKIELVKE